LQQLQPVRRHRRSACAKGFSGQWNPHQVLIRSQELLSHLHLIGWRIDGTSMLTKAMRGQCVKYKYSMEVLE